MKRVRVAYDGGINRELDRLLRHTVLAAGGREMGSGSMLVAPYRRDIEFEFPDALVAQRFTEGLGMWSWMWPSLTIL